MLIDKIGHDAQLDLMHIVRLHSINLVLNYFILSVMKSQSVNVYTPLENWIHKTQCP